MKNLIKGTLFWITIVAIIITMSAVATILAEITIMEMIMTVVYITVGFGVIYILKN